MKIIIDTNIIFSSLLNSNGTIGDLIFNSETVFEFYSCSYMQQEIHDHWDKLKRISKLSEDNLQDSRIRVFKKINFINEELIPKSIWRKAEEIVKDIDPDDIDFIVLTRYLKGKLWTGDKQLYKGLKLKNFKAVLTTEELVKLRNKPTN